MDKLKWKKVESEHVIQDEWIDFRKETYELPDGTVSGPYYAFSRKSYAVIAAVDTEGKFLCVRQYRYGISEVTCEFAAGGIEVTGHRPSEAEALHAAKRELKEETGYVSDTWKHLLTIPSFATMNDDYAYIYLALNCHRVSEQKLDATEFLNVETHTEKEMEEMIQTGKFQQAVHVLAYELVCRELYR